MSESTPPTQWLLARIIEIFPEDDGLVQTGKLKTASSQLKRPITKLILLPVNVN